MGEQSVVYKGLVDTLTMIVVSFSSEDSTRISCEVVGTRYRELCGVGGGQSHDAMLRILSYQTLSLLACHN